MFCGEQNKPAPSLCAKTELQSELVRSEMRKYMIKVFLAEDEFIVRQGIKNNIDWEKNGFEFCGEASDGELAFPIICREKPDIVITDIRMPFMDGLVLSRLIRRELPHTKIIILSGHEEFEYAKAAIQIGVEEYLLKPIRGEELLQVVNHVAEKIRQERQAEQEEKALQGAEVQFLVGNVSPGNMDKQKIHDFLREGEIHAVRPFVEEYIHGIGDAGENSLLFRQYLVMDMYFAANQFLAEIGAEGVIAAEEPFQTPEKMQQTISGLESTLSYVADLFTRVMEERDRLAGQSTGDVVESARQYIQERYQDAELTLNSEAAHVNISRNHLSTLFGQKTGQTFMKYLTDVRMDKARELLRFTNKKSSEICEEVGYRDPHYFSYIFKKNNGCTPMQYRERSGEA